MYTSSPDTCIYCEGNPGVNKIYIVFRYMYIYNN
jgi:hypothetical protein